MLYQSFPYPLCRYCSLQKGKLYICQQDLPGKEVTRGRIHWFGLRAGEREDGGRFPDLFCLLIPLMSLGPSFF